MNDLIKIVLEKGDHWSLGILLFCVILLGFFNLPLLKKLHVGQNFKFANNLLWSVTGVCVIFIVVVLMRDLSRDKKEIALAEIEHGLKLIDKNADLVKSDSTLTRQINTTFKQFQKNNPINPDPHPIEDESIDHNRCWIKTSSSTDLVQTPTFMLDEGVIAHNIPINIYYVLDKKRISQGNVLFFKIELENGLIGWVRDWQLDKNPKCYD